MEKIQVLRSLALPKLQYVCSKTQISKEFIKRIENSIKDFIWNGRKPKIKHDTLIGDYLNGGLKLPEFSIVIKANKIKRILDLKKSYKENKIFSSVCSSSLESIGGMEQIGTNFNPQRIPASTPDIIRQQLLAWADYANTQSSIEKIQIILNQNIWNNKYIQIDNKSVFYRTFSTNNINKIVDMCDNEGNFDWTYIKTKGLQDSDYLKWAGLVHAIPKDWKNNIKLYRNEIDQNRNAMDNNFLVGQKIIEIEKVKTKEIYHDIMQTKFKPPYGSNKNRKKNNYYGWTN